MEPVIALRQAGKTYATPAGPFVALHGVDLEVARGEMLAVVGKSGSGKSTLLNLIGGIDRATMGEVRVAGTSVHDASEDVLARWRGRHVGVVFQFFQLLPTLTAIENVKIGIETRQKSGPIAAKIFDALGG